MGQTFRIEGYDNLFEVVDQSHTQTTYGAIAHDGICRFHSFFVTPFADQVESV